jgi:hypothetical protein
MGWREREANQIAERFDDHRAAHARQCPLEVPFSTRTPI